MNTEPALVGRVIRATFARPLLAALLVAARVGQVTPQLPPGTDAPLISSLTGRLYEVFELTLEAEPGVADLMTLRDLAEFEVRNRLLAVPGVAAVERLGGYLRQFQVQLDPERMAARGVTPTGGIQPSWET